MNMRAIPNGDYSVNVYEVSDIDCDAVIVNDWGVWAARRSDCGGYFEHIEIDGEYVPAPMAVYAHFQYGKTDDGRWFAEQVTLDHYSRSWFENGTKAYNFVRRMNKGHGCKVVKVMPSANPTANKR